MLGVANGARSSDIGFLENLNRRGVLETGVAYLVVGWLLIQIADIVFGQLHLPPWAGTFVTILVIAGFPIALVLSWFLEFRDGKAVADVLSPSDRRRKRFSRTYMSVVGALGAAAVLVATYDYLVGIPGPASPVGEITESPYLPPVADNSIGVLPFMALDDSEESRIFANAIPEDVLTRLSRVPELLVSSRGDSFTLEPNTPSSRVRERLRVAKYVEGSVQFDGETMRVVVQLIDSKTGYHILSRTFDRPLNDYFGMRDDITELAVANVRPALPPETRKAVMSSSIPAGVDVYIAYRRGVDASHRPDVQEWIDDALEWFEVALGRDPEYAPAHAGKCDALVEAYIWLDDAQYIEAAESACEMALNLNPNLDVVFTSLGDLYRATGRLQESEDAYSDALRIDPENAAALVGLGEVYRLQQRAAEAEDVLRKAAGLHPGDWSAYNALGTFLYRSGRFAEAAAEFRKMVALDDENVRGYTNLATALVLAEQFEAAEPAFKRALELEPTGLTYSNYGMLLYNLGRFDEAVESHRKAVELENQDYLARSNLGDALWAAGKKTQSRSVFAEAEALAHEALAVNPNDAFVQMDLAWIKTVLEKHDEADDLIERAMTSVPDDPYVHYIKGIMLNRRGDSQGAVQALGQSVELGYSKKMLGVDPHLANLADNPAFRTLAGLSE
ncbi:MAG: tetratricopeptide repeat protein [Woeseiaceae bacterium]|nr:tetratricopeptide repeat protein [Woeseiaceae bacterium]